MESWDCYKGLVLLRSHFCILVDRISLIITRKHNAKLVAACNYKAFWLTMAWQLVTQPYYLWAQWERYEKMHKLTNIRTETQTNDCSTIGSIFFEIFSKFNLVAGLEIPLETLLCLRPLAIESSSMLPSESGRVITWFRSLVTSWSNYLLIGNIKAFSPSNDLYGYI